MTRERMATVVLATIGAVLLLVVMVTRHGAAGDEYAYWKAGNLLIQGQPIYDPTANAVTPTAFWYPPIVAQVLAPIAAVVPWPLFSAAWIGFMLACIWWLADRDVLTALALCAFPPVAVELWWRNIHLPLAVVLVLGIRRWGGWLAVGAAIKIAPVLGIAYLALRRQWREAGIAIAFGAGLLAVSVLLSPAAWLQFIDVVTARGTDDQSTFLLIPYAVRLVAAIVLVVVASRLERRWGDPLLVVAVVVGLPTLWFNGLSVLIALVPLLRRPFVGDRQAA